MEAGSNIIVIVMNEKNNVTRTQTESSNYANWSVNKVVSSMTSRRYPTNIDGTETMLDFISVFEQTFSRHSTKMEVLRMMKNFTKKNKRGQSLDADKTIEKCSTTFDVKTEKPRQKLKRATVADMKMRSRWIITERGGNVRRGGVTYESHQVNQKYT